MIVLEINSIKIEKLIIEKAEKIIFLIDSKLNNIKNQYKTINNFQEKNLINKNKVYILINKKIKNKISKNIIKKIYKKNKIIKINQIN